MIRALLTFCGLIAVIAYSQPTCQLKHNHWDDLPAGMSRSGNESLRSDTVNVLHYSIYLDFTQIGSGVLAGSCDVKFEALMNINSISLDLLLLNIDSIVFQGNQIPFSYNDTLIVAQLGTTVNTSQVGNVTVYYNGTPQQDPSGWGGFYLSGQYFYNLGVGFDSDPHNFGRAWHPCFDNFVERATYDFQILTANNNTAYCNGTRTDVQPVGVDSLLTSWEMSTEIPSYLASVAVAPYTHVQDAYLSTLQSTTIPIWLAAKAVDTTNVKNSFIHLHDALSAFENAYGPYVWERIGYVMVPFNSGAMEHATNIAYPLATANGSTFYETLMAHELSHHWWGDWVTCETAEEMWINEGMAVYSEHLFMENVYSSAAYLAAVRDNHYNVLHRAHIDDSGHYALNAVPIKYTYGEHSYRKGADVIHTLRGYMGDANFFAGLKSVQTAFGGGNASSEDFRNQLNTLAGVDVTDFFNDWIFQPGFSQFAIVNSSITQNGSNYDVEILVDQKLKGAANFHTNVPLLVTFKDAGWNSYSENIMMSGDYATFTFSVPFEPEFMALNMDEKINDAVTAQELVINTVGVKLLNYANTRIDVSSITDSAYVRAEHNWVYADNLHSIPNLIVSQDRYWNIHGIDLDKMTGTIRFVFNGQHSSNGDLDNSILQSTGNQPFHEDSLVLLYRPDAISEWQIHPDFTVNTTGSPTDKSGYILANYFAAGQYCFGYKVQSVGIAEKPISSLGYSIYPNPASDTLIIDLTSWENGAYMVEIYAINGQFIGSRALQGGQLNQLSVSSLDAGSYLLILTDNQRRLGSKRVVVSK